MSPEVAEVQGRLVGPYRGVQLGSTVVPWGGKGELTVLGSEDPT
jgi:hypothetical protein